MHTVHLQRDIEDAWSSAEAKECRWECEMLQEACAAACHSAKKKNHFKKKERPRMCQMRPTICQKHANVYRNVKKESYCERETERGLIACLERVSHLLPLPELQDTLLDERIRDSVLPIARLFANLVGAQRKHGASLLHRPRKSQTHKKMVLQLLSKTYTHFKMMLDLRDGSVRSTHFSSQRLLHRSTCALCPRLPISRLAGGGGSACWGARSVGLLLRRLLSLQCTTCLGCPAYE